MNNTILCFDLGTKTGWAMCGGRGDIFSGTVDFKSRRFEGGGMRYLRFKRWLTEIKHTAGNISDFTFS